MSEKVTNFVNSVKQQDYATAKSEFQTAMAERINSAFENKKIELAKNMTEGTQVEEESEQFAEETQDLDEGKIRKFLFKTLNRKKDKKDFNPFHWQSAKDMVSKHLGSGSKEGKEILDKHSKLASGAKYAEMSDKAAKKALADNMDTLADDINAAKKKQK